MSKVESYIYAQEGFIRQQLIALHEYLTENCGLEPQMKYGIPFYYGRSWVCYLNVRKEKKVEFAFTRGNELSNTWERLSFRGRKQVSSVIFDQSELQPINQGLEESLQEALVLDETTQYSVRK